MTNIKSNLKFYKKEHTNYLEYNLDCENAGTDHDASCYINSAIDSWITEATHRHHPMILNVKFKNPYGQKSTYALPIFPAELDRSPKSLIAYLNGNTGNIFKTKDQLDKNKTTYRNDLLRYMKFLVANEYNCHKEQNEGQISDDQKKKFKFLLMNGFKFETFNNAVEKVVCFNDANSKEFLYYNEPSNDYDFLSPEEAYYYDEYSKDFDFRRVMEDNNLIKKCVELFENRKANNQWGNN